MIMYYSMMLHNTWYGWAVKGGIPWLWPAFETLHFFGMALLVGCVGALDLRMLGLGKGLPLGPLQRLVPFGILGFAINLITGLGFYAGDPSQYQSGAFFWKMTFILLAGCNVILFYVTGLHRRVDLLGAGADVPLGAKFIAGVSLFLWLGVMFWGRMLPVFSNAF